MYQSFFLIILLMAMGSFVACNTPATEADHLTQNSAAQQESSEHHSGMKYNCTFAALKKDKDFCSNYDSSARLNPDLINILKNKKDKLTFILFLGTWCIDSKNIIPLFFNYLEKAQWDTEHRLFISCVDKDKKMADGGNLSEFFNIMKVPTIIVLKDGKEVNRVIEFGQDFFPNQTVSFHLWENALASVLAKTR